MTDQPSEEAMAVAARCCPYFYGASESVHGHQNDGCRICEKTAHALEEFRAAGEALVFDSMADAKDAAHQDWEDRFAALERERDELRAQLVVAQEDSARLNQAIMIHRSAVADGECKICRTPWPCRTFRALTADMPARNQEESEDA